MSFSSWPGTGGFSPITTPPELMQVTVMEHLEKVGKSMLV